MRVCCRRFIYSYSFLSAIIIICMVLTFLDLQNQIKHSLSTMIFQVPKFESFDSVLLDLNQLSISQNEIWNFTKCAQMGYKSKRKTIVIIPYRNRLTNLKLFLSPLHQQLMSQVILFFLVKYDMNQEIFNINIFSYLVFNYLILEN